MMSRTVSVALLLALSAGPASAEKSRAGATANSAKAGPSKTTGISGQMLTKPGQNAIGGKAPAPISGVGGHP